MWKPKVFTVVVMAAVCFGLFALSTAPIAFAVGPEPVKKPGPIDMPAVVTGCMNSNCRCTQTVSGCLNCISRWCDAVWDEDEDKLYNWWCRNKSRKGC